MPNKKASYVESFSGVMTSYVPLGGACIFDRISSERVSWTLCPLLVFRATLVRVYIVEEKLTGSDPPGRQPPLCPSLLHRPVCRCAHTLNTDRCQLLLQREHQ